MILIGIETQKLPETRQQANFPHNRPRLKSNCRITRTSAKLQCWNRTTVPVLVELMKHAIARPLSIPLRSALIAPNGWSIIVAN